MKNIRTTAFRSLKHFCCKNLWLTLDDAANSAKAQRDALAQLSEELIEMTEHLLIEMEVDRDGARSLIAEFSGLFEQASNAASILLDFDEFFGGTKSNRPRMAVLGKKLEVSLSYLSGVLSAIHVSDELSYVDWVNVKSDIDAVWKICRTIAATESGVCNLKLAA